MQDFTPASSRAADTDDLAKLASTINDCLLKVDDHLLKADDQRVLAAQHLAQAKKACKSASITFKDWCEREIEFSYDEALKLATAGASSDPAKAIADIRKSNAIRNKLHRAKTVSRDTAAPARKCSSEEAALAAIGKLSPETRRNLIRSQADCIALEDKRDSISDANDVDAQVKGIVMHSLRGLSTNQAEKVLCRLHGLIDEISEEYGKAQGSLPIDKPANNAGNSDDLEIPPSLDRRPKDGDA